MMMKFLSLFLVLVIAQSVYGFIAVVPHSSQTLVASNPIQLRMTKLVYNGKAKEFKAGTPLSKAVAQLGVKVTYSCRKGDCATCQVLMDGRMTRACTGKVPDAPKDKAVVIASV